MGFSGTLRSRFLPPNEYSGELGRPSAAPMFDLAVVGPGEHRPRYSLFRSPTAYLRERQGERVCNHCKSSSGAVVV